jgi:hypothetical protein
MHVLTARGAKVMARAPEIERREASKKANKWHSEIDYLASLCCSKIVHFINKK